MLQFRQRYVADLSGVAALGNVALASLTSAACVLFIRVVFSVLLIYELRVEGGQVDEELQSGASKMDELMTCALMHCSQTRVPELRARCWLQEVVLCETPKRSATPTPMRVWRRAGSANRWRSLSRPLQKVSSMSSGDFCTGGAS
mmetsp:Transcript_8682/g.35760  ORF Transcript_8682/g.35760 Transcript_8682/m.35760 type:complete len:145 (-) Transcript_8682:623-1057(-)